MRAQKPRRRTGNVLQKEQGDATLVAKLDKVSSLRWGGGDQGAMGVTKTLTSRWTLTQQSSRPAPPSAPVHLLGRLGEEHAVVGNNADRVAVHAGEAWHTAES